MFGGFSRLGASGLTGKIRLRSLPGTELLSVPSRGVEATYLVRALAVPKGHRSRTRRSRVH